MRLRVCAGGRSPSLVAVVPRRPGRKEHRLHLSTRARGLGLAALAGVIMATLNPAPQPVAAATAADRVISVAQAQLGDPWVWAATGPNAFDCSGLVIYA